MPAISTRKRKLNPPRFVVAIDIGTTCSGASYCINGGPGEAPVFKEVRSDLIVYCMHDTITDYLCKVYRWPKQVRQGLLIELKLAAQRQFIDDNECQNPVSYIL